MRCIAALPLALWASAAGAAFHPVEDRPYRYETVETRTTDRVALRFHAARTVVFHRTDAGYTASVTLDAVDQQGPGGVGRMFLAATGALLHRTIHYRLDAAGTVTHVEDVDAAIARIAEAIERMNPPDTARSGHSKTLASPLRTMPDDRKTAMLRSILAPLIAGSTAERASGQQPVTVPSRPPLPPGSGLPGIETVSRNASGIVTIDLRAQGAVNPAPPAGLPGRVVAGPASRPAATLHTIRNIDPVSGLLRDSHEISESSITDGSTIHIARIESVMTLTLATN